MIKLLMGTALSAMLLATAAQAQSTQPAPARPAPPAAAPSTTAPPGAATVTTAAEDNMASRLIGSSIRNTANETIGEVSDLVLDNTGKVKTVIVVVGGFLGIGEHKVALRYDQLQSTRDASGKSIMMSSMTRDQLKALPEWRDPNAAATAAPTRTR